MRGRAALECEAWPLDFSRGSIGEREAHRCALRGSNAAHKLFWCHREVNNLRARRDGWHFSCSNCGEYSRLTFVAGLFGQLRIHSETFACTGSLQEEASRGGKEYAVQEDVEKIRRPEKGRKE